MSDAFDARLALAAPGLLREFNEAGVLAPADVHVARRLCELAGEDDERVALAAALAVRAPRLGHVYADLATIRETAAVDADDPVDLSALPWPAPGELVGAAAASGLVVPGDESVGERPLRLAGSRLYLDRYWREERRIADDLVALRDRPPAAVDPQRLEEGLARMFAEDSRQRLAAETAVRRRFAVVAGGPGTGKTTTVARILALLFEQTDSPPLVGLAAPTGKAADRLQQAIGEEAGELAIGDETRRWLHGLAASTLHRLLGWRPGTHSRFRHHRGNRLPHDVVIVDETSMVSLSLMARLVEAVRPDARLVLVGDPGQLASIEAGAVLGDIVGPDDAPGIVVLDRVHRYERGGAIARVAEAIRRGDADATVAALRDAEWTDDPEVLREPASTAFDAVAEAAKAGDATAAIEVLGAFRVLCAHRHGPHGVSAWTARVRSWLDEGLADEWYAGRPLLVTENDYGLGLLNGDTGVTVTNADGTLSAAFERRNQTVSYSPSRLAAVETVYAMTVHKSQGSQFATAAVVLPEPGSPLLTRELLYTAVTRARERLIVVGGEESVRAAVARPVARSSGLRERLWGSASVSPPR